MFFSGDSSSRKRVDLGGRSSKERDRQKLLEQTRLERQRRLGLRMENSAAIKIQKCFRGRKVVEAERLKTREQFYHTYGERCQKVDRTCFNHNSDFLRQLLFFFDAQNSSDFSVLVETCRLLHQFVRVSGDVVKLFGEVNSIVEHRVKKLAYACLLAVHQNRTRLKDQLLIPSDFSNVPVVLLLEGVIIFTDPESSMSCKTVDYLCQRHMLALLRDIVHMGMQNPISQKAGTQKSLVEHILIHVISHVGHNQCNCLPVDERWSFSSQFLTIPFLWPLFPYLRQVFLSEGFFDFYIHQIAVCVHSHAKFLPDDVSHEFPGGACLLGNILEVAGASLSRSNCSFDLAVDFVAVSTFMLEELPAITTPSQENAAVVEDEMDVDVDKEVISMNKGLEQQICNAVDSRLLQQLVSVLFRGSSLVKDSSKGSLQKRDITAVGAICVFLHVIFNTLPIEGIMIGVAYRTELVPMLCNFMKQCHEKQKWPSLSELTSNLSDGAPGWLLPLAVFCPVYKHMLVIVDNEEFYELEKPLLLKDIKGLIIILKQALWQVLWVFPPKSSSTMKFVAPLSGQKRLSVDFLLHRVGLVTSDLLSQLQDWNNRREFTVPSDFQAQEAVDEIFISQAATENTRAYDILRQAPFLVPFTSRIKIFTSYLTSARQRNWGDTTLLRNRFRIRRDRIFEDAFNQMSVLSEDQLRGMIRVTFVNEFGVEEAGIDGGGIFKDFMENITRSAFDVQYGLFKETSDHLLYPNPASGLVHEQHLQFFNFLGIVLGKAMFEGVLVDIPLATFFLSKLKQKYNYLNDLPSLDPELYRHLIFLKHYKGDLSELELYFVIVNNEYGEQSEEELVTGGKTTRVTNENVIQYIHLVANQRLNSQIRQQSSYFLRGFQQLIEKDWISMFNEQELQLLISGSLEGLDFDDLRSHAQYGGGYHANHYVIDMFWEVFKEFSQNEQQKFMKFVTGSSRGPLLGFNYLEPKFCIQRVAGDVSEELLDRLPTSATCMNLLKLPPYRSKEQMKRKLIYSINAEAGFDLS